MDSPSLSSLFPANYENYLNLIRSEDGIQAYPVIAVALHTLSSIPCLKKYTEISLYGLSGATAALSVYDIYKRGVSGDKLLLTMLSAVFIASTYFKPVEKKDNAVEGREPHSSNADPLSIEVLKKPSSLNAALSSDEEHEKPLDSTLEETDEPPSSVNSCSQEEIELDLKQLKEKLAELEENVKTLEQKEKLANEKIEELVAERDELQRKVQNLEQQIVSEERLEKLLNCETELKSIADTLKAFQASLKTEEDESDQA